MNKSDSINELASAMSLFQSQSSNIFKSKEGHGYNYADLAAILDGSRDLLGDNNLAIIQMPCAADVGHVGVETLITHSSGQWIEQSYSMPIPDNKRNSAAQNLGSAVTYARRYAAAAALGIAQTDNDASEVVFTIDATAQSWIDAGKVDIKVLDQLTDLNYKNFIMSEVMK